MNELEINGNLFESIKHIDENGVEFWYARELKDVLDYKEWRKFENVIDKAKQSCENSGMNAFEHFVGADKMVKIGSGAVSRQKDYTEDEKRFYQRDLTRKGNYSLNQAAKEAGVKNFDKFHNAGYKGLYNGETADDIAKRKGLRYREDILDNMCSEELAANLFRITQTESRLIREKVDTENKANQTHYEVGAKIRETIKELGGTMPEDLPTPKKSLKELEKERREELKEKDDNNT